MTTLNTVFKTGSLILAGLLLSSCASDGVTGSVSYSAHYGSSWGSPMYYGHWHDSPDIIVVPPPKRDRPDARPPGGRPKPPRSRPSRR